MNKLMRKSPVSLPSLGEFLIYSGASANISLWVQAGLMTEGKEPLAVFSSFALGMAMSFGAVEIVKKWALLEPTLSKKVRGKDEEKTRPNPRYWLAVVSFAVILIMEVLLLGVVVQALMAGVKIYSLLGPGLSWAWSFGRVAASATVIAGLAAVLGAHAPKSDAQKSDKPTKSEQVQLQPAAVPAQSELERRKCEEPGCTMDYSWPNGKGAHYKKYHAPIKVDESLLIKGKAVTK